MNLIDTYEILGFSSWACALTNNDESGMEDEDIEMLNKWLEAIPAPHKIPIGMLDDKAFRHNVYGGLGGDSVTYIFPVYDVEPKRPIA